MKTKDWIITLLVVVTILLVINNTISIGHNHRMVDMLSEQQEFLGNTLLDIAESHTSLSTVVDKMLDTQGVVLDILGDLIYFEDLIEEEQYES